MDKLAHDRVIIGMVLSLGIAHILKGIAKLIENPKKFKAYWVHLLWVGYSFLLLIYFWWWEYKLSLIQVWSFGTYVFLILYTVLIYLICSLLFPDDMKDYGSFREYYYTRGQWFFGLLGLTFIVDLGDTLLKGSDYIQALGPEYYWRNSIHFVLCMLLMRVKKQRFHAIAAIAFILYGISWILRKYAIQ